MRNVTSSAGRIGARTRVLTPKEFIALSPEQRAQVVRVQPVPPKLGRGGFGNLMVEFRPLSTRYIKSFAAKEFVVSKGLIHRVRRAG